MIFELNRLGANNGVIEWRLDCNRNNWTKPLLYDVITSLNILMCT